MKQRAGPWSELIDRDLDRRHHAQREAAEQQAIIDAIAEADEADRRRLEARRKEMVLKAKGK